MTAPDGGHDATLSKGAAHEERGHLVECRECSYEGRAAHEERGLDEARLAEAIFRVGIGYRQRDTATIAARIANSQDGAKASGEFAEAVATEYARLTTPEAAPEDDTRFHRPNFRGDHCAQCREPWPCPWATPEAAPECRHPANRLTDHADNPSRFRCRDCDSVLVDYGDGLGYVNRSATPEAAPEPDFCPECGGQYSDLPGHRSHAHGVTPEAAPISDQ